MAGLGRRWVLYKEAKRVLEDIGELRLHSPKTIYTGDMEEALEEGSEVFRLIESGGNPGWYAVRRPYSGVNIEFYLLSRMSAALRLRMMELNKLYVTGLDYFHKRLDSAVSRAYSLVEA
ncbi:hypothetical protein APE_0906 [Aeropyrum pernix K1]|uniref:Uncharacterized protein n=1 Tax=Aeropyrum pernix (strain ATCC 700893 / DSM 11879 / JCM 9820 / NBRC 100138 / K1) TaxID=272557 RepID=Q9YDK7_AERPE|nr:hypothetical protein [Aeropyrum pernix]BAA79890.1 hypothetical protein APE_0906 [Aeropyrum pernix K1]